MAGGLSAILFVLAYSLLSLAVWRLRRRLRPSYLALMQRVMRVNADVNVLVIDFIVVFFLLFGLWVISLVVFDQFSPLLGTAILVTGAGIGVQINRWIEGETQRLGEGPGFIRREMSLIGGGFLVLIGALAVLGLIS